MIQTADQLVAKDLSNLAMLGKWVEDIQLHGSFSARRPDLGKMINCPACQRRHRMIGPRCSNAAFATTQRAWSPEEGFHQVACEPRENQAMFGKALFRKMKHKRHGQSKRNAVRVLTIAMQNDPARVQRALDEMQRAFVLVKAPDVTGIPAFAVKYFMWREDLEQRRIRGQQGIATRVNRGFAKAGSRYSASNYSRRHEAPSAPLSPSGEPVAVKLPTENPTPESA